jgi:hypothetical protein
MASWKRRFPETTVAVIRELCIRTGAKVVFNTTHNMPFKDTDDIDVALEKQGLDREHIHQTDLATKYPDLARDLPVKDWLYRHPEVTEWIALDDVKFTDDERLIWVDPDAGVHLGHLNEAIERLGGKPVIVLM